MGFLAEVYKIGSLLPAFCYNMRGKLNLIGKKS